MSGSHVMFMERLNAFYGACTTFLLVKCLHILIMSVNVIKTMQNT